MADKMTYDFRIKPLGPCKVPSPKPYSTKYGDAVANYTRDDQYILRSNTAEASSMGPDYDPAWILEGAGPRENI